jgi:hypothetical protein
MEQIKFSSTAIHICAIYVYKSKIQYKYRVLELLNT